MSYCKGSPTEMGFLGEDFVISRPVSQYLTFFLFLERFIFCGAIAQFVISTVHIATGWRDILETFIWNLDFPGGPAKYKSMNPARPTAVIAQVVVIINVSPVMMSYSWMLR